MECLGISPYSQIIYPQIVEAWNIFHALWLESRQNEMSCQCTLDHIWRDSVDPEEGGRIEWVCIKPESLVNYNSVKECTIQSLLFHNLLTFMFLFMYSLLKNNFHTEDNNSECYIKHNNYSISRKKKRKNVIYIFVFIKHD